ncbi:MAG: hypothetical protein ACRD0K_06355 [Egibacteraceae bacterium]
MQQWDEIEQFMIAEAERDLTVGQEVRPCFTAFAGPTPLVLAFVRPFPKGGYQQPLIELIALAAPLDADRLKLSITGRAWSLLDPIPPVDAQAGDLRQRVLSIESVDAHAGRPRSHSVLVPFDVVDGAVVWGEPTRMTGGEGWIPFAFRRAVRVRGRLRGASIADLRAQAERCAALGHLIALGPTVADRLGARI